MSNVIPLKNSGGMFTPQMLLDKAKTVVDDMDGVLLVYYKEGTQRSVVEYLTSNLTVQDANWFLDQIKAILHKTV
jgi:hypothetical protein